VSPDRGPADPPGPARSRTPGPPPSRVLPRSRPRGSVRAGPSARSDPRTNPSVVLPSERPGTVDVDAGSARVGAGRPAVPGRPVPRRSAARRLRPTARRGPRVRVPMAGHRSPHDRRYAVSVWNRWPSVVAWKRYGDPAGRYEGAAEIRGDRYPRTRTPWSRLPCVRVIGRRAPNRGVGPGGLRPAPSPRIPRQRPMAAHACRTAACRATCGPTAGRGAAGGSRCRGGAPRPYRASRRRGGHR
jgi:hypothetical protein